MNDLGEEDEPKASKWISATWLVSSPTLLFKYIKTYIVFLSELLCLLNNFDSSLTQAVLIVGDF